MDTPDAPLPEGNVPLDDLIEELGTDPADFERTPAQRQADPENLRLSRLDPAAKERAEALITGARAARRARRRVCWLLYDCDDFVGVFASEAGANAARVARQDKARADMGDEWNPSFDEAIEVTQINVQD
jgi:hypothetical protein